MGKKRFLHIIPSLNPGGAEVLLRNSIALLHEFEHKVIIFQKEENELEVNASVIYLNLNLPKAFNRARREVNQIIKSYKPHVINAHLYWSVILIRFCKTKDAKVYNWYHSDMYHPLNEEQYSVWRKVLDKITSRRQYHLVFVTDYLRKQISERVGVKGIPHVVHNFIDSRYFEVEPTETSSHALRILMVGNLRKQKNHQVVFEAFKMIQDFPIELKLVGEGPMREQLQVSIQSLGLKNAFLIGHHEDVAHHLANTDLYIMPSLFEGFGISLVEAMAAGVACIASDIPPFREIGGDDLIYFKPHDAQDLANQISKFIDLPYRQTLGQKAKIRAQNFSPSRYLQKLKKLYSIN